MPSQPLTPDRIVASAIELLDAESLDGLNMRALGARLESAPTAVYWHVGSKERLIGLAADRCWNELELPDLDALDWRSAAEALARELHAMVIAHPWLVQAAGSYVLYGPGKARHDDTVYAIFEKAGFTGSEADRAAAALLAYVLGTAVGPGSQLARARQMRRDPTAEQQLRDGTASATEIAMGYPRLRERLEAPAELRPTPDEMFVFGLRVVLDGLEKRAGATSG